MSNSVNPAELVEQLTELNEKIIRYGSIVIGENQKLKDRVKYLNTEIEKLKAENEALRKGLVPFSEN